MALPSAQLGSMSSLSGPSYVPTVVLAPKEEKYWKKALASILTQVAAGAATQGLTNTMQRDNAAEFGETPATGWDKVWQGPKVDKNEAVRRRESAKQDERLLASAKLQLGLGDIAAAESRTNREAAVQNNERAASDRRMSWYEEMAAKTRGNTADNRWDDARQEGADARALARLDKQIEAEEPYRKSQIGVNEAQTKRYNAEADWNKQLMEGALGGKGGKDSKAPSSAGADERARAFAERNNLNDKQSAVQRRLQDTERYPTYDQLFPKEPAKERYPVGQGGGVYVPPTDGARVPPAGSAEAVSPTTVQDAAPREFMRDLFSSLPPVDEASALYRIQRLREAMRFQKPEQAARSQAEIDLLIKKFSR